MTWTASPAAPATPRATRKGVRLTLPLGRGNCTQG